MHCFPVSAVRELERNAVSAGIAEYQLMFSAGRQAADIVNFHYPDAIRFAVLCGGGNNGGDAMVAARILYERYKREVVIYSTVKRERFSGCAAQAAGDLPEAVPFIEYEGKTLPDDAFAPGDVIIDGVLGIGFRGDGLRCEAADFIRKANESGNPVVALDLPSGIAGDSGKASVDGAINADLTITFGVLKNGLFAGSGSRCRGKLRLADIGLKAHSIGGNEYFTNQDAVTLIPHPEFDCHKNSRGRVTLFCGSSEYPGAGALAARGALHSGCGIVRLHSAAGCRSYLPAAVIFNDCSTRTADCEWERIFASGDVIAAGCGWGSSIDPAVLRKLFEFPGRLLLDADALNMISADPALWKEREQLIITPHPGEAGRLADAFNIKTDRADRRAFAGALAARLGAVTLLKGRDTVVASPDGRTTVITSGNHALATAGSGDVLAGIIAGIAAGNIGIFDAAALGAYIHGVAGENAPGIMIADQLPQLAAEVISKIRKNQIF